ncbi:MAG TPA: sigma-54 dependent transcriptional regulator [Thermoanaerobaculia bacterium]|nr:sigma-54 dependent transcriptional regulator [Thermoanaerobaculia bacterium]
MTTGKARIFIVDDEAIVRESLGGWFTNGGYSVEMADSGKQALDRLGTTDADVFLLDIKMPGMDGIELQKKIREAKPDAMIIVMTAYASVDTAVTAMKQGAWDYIIKPFDPDELEHLVRNALEHRRLLAENQDLKARIDDLSPFADIIGESPAMRRVLEQVTIVARADTNVLIRGESGTGKELVARALHAGSERRFLPIVVVNCGALSEGLIESELFGHEKGAFTGAQYRRKGKLEMADGGTLFLDEIGDITLKTQVDLLRVLEEKKIVRVGGNVEIPVDFRLVAATNRNLEAMVAEGKFREDLYYRLNVFSIAIPPLRERREDIAPLAKSFLARFARAMNKPVAGISPEAMALLTSYDWPGNVRELQNALERAVLVCRGKTAMPEDLPFHVNGSKSSPAPLGKSLSDVERLHVRRVLEEAGWNITRAARLLEIDRVTLYNKIKKYGFEKERPEA